MTEIDRLYDVVRKHELRNKGKLYRDGIDPDKGEKVKGERWRNIYRMDSGFDYGYKLFSSEALARDGANRTCAVYDPRLPSENADGNIEMQGKIRYVLQLPWRE